MFDKFREVTEISIFACSCVTQRTKRSQKSEEYNNTANTSDLIQTKDTKEVNNKGKNCHSNPEVTDLVVVVVSMMN